MADYDFTYTGAEIQAILDTGKKLKDSGYIFLGVATPSTNPGTPTQKVYYEAKQAGTYTNFGGVVLPDGISLLIWNGSWTSETVMCGDGGVFDISVYKSTGGTLATFADLAAALNGGNNIPVGVRKGGMSVKFVQSSDNKYVQYRYMGTSTANADFSNVANWQGFYEQELEDSEFSYVVEDSVKRISLGIKKDGSIFFGAGVPQQVVEYIQNKIEELSLDKVDDIIAFVGDLLEGDKDLQGLFDEKVDKEEGKSLIDKTYAEGISYIDDNEFAEILTDSKDKIASCRDKFGVLYEKVGIETPTLKVNGVDIKSIFDLEKSYNQILVDERCNLLKKWIPYFWGVPFDYSYSNLQGNTPYYNRCNLIFFTDSHIEEPSDYAANVRTPSFENLKNTIAFINNCPVKIDAVMQAGDNITPFNELPHDYAIEWAKIYYNELKKSKVPVCVIRGNHDNNDWLNYPSEVITKEDFNKLWYDFAEEKYGIVRNPAETNIKVVGENVETKTVKSMYHYYDILSKKIRVICIDVEDIDRVTTDNNGHCKFYGTTMFYVAQKQLDWIANIALKNLDDGWGVIFVSHQNIWYNFLRGYQDDPRIVWYYDTRSTPRIEENLSKLFRIMYAFNTQKAYSNVYNYAGEQYNGFYNLNISADYTSYAERKSWLNYRFPQESSYTYTYGKYACVRTISEGLIVKMVDANNNLSKFSLYVRYSNNETDTLIGEYNTNEEITVPLEGRIEYVYVRAYNSDTTSTQGLSFSIVERKPHIIGWFTGHEHEDYNLALDLADPEDIGSPIKISENGNGINLICTAEASFMPNAASDCRIVRLLDTATQSLFDVVNIDTLMRKIRIFRYGAGVTCFGTNGDRFLPNGLDY